MTALSLVHHVHDGTVRPGAEYADAWSTTPVQDAPPITDAMEQALRRVVLDYRHNGSDPTRWHHCAGWSAVLDLHRAGRHGDALDLARLLHWCDQRFNGRVDGHWEIVRGESR